MSANMLPRTLRLLCSLSYLICVAACGGSGAASARNGGTGAGGERTTGERGGGGAAGGGGASAGGTTGTGGQLASGGAAGVGLSQGGASGQAGGGAGGAAGAGGRAPAVFTAGTMVDPRDGTEYRTVDVDGVTWMAENLRYRPTNAELKGGKALCFQPSLFDYCTPYGVYYGYQTLAAACPPGWRVPSAADFQNLFDAHSPDPAQASVMMRAASWKGTNDHGFNVLPAGYYNGRSTVAYVVAARTVDGADPNPMIAEFWTSTTRALGYTYQVLAEVLDRDQGVSLYETPLDTLPNYFTLRCVK